jgi:hypothetical protein
VSYRCKAIAAQNGVDPVHQIAEPITTTCDFQRPATILDEAFQCVPGAETRPGIIILDIARGHRGEAGGTGVERQDRRVAHVALLPVNVTWGV